MNKHILFCQRLIKGEIPFQKPYYQLDNSSKIEQDKNKNDPNFTVISPTQANVSHAVSEIREQESINRGRKQNYDQIGGKSIKQRVQKAKKFKL